MKHGGRLSAAAVSALRTRAGLAPSERAESSSAMVAAKACAAAAVEALETNDAAALASALRGAAASAVNEKVVGGKLADTALGTSLDYEDGDTLLHLC